MHHQSHFSNIPRVVTTQDGFAVAKSLGVSFFETSAKTRQFVEEAFYQSVREFRSVTPSQVHKII